LNQLHKIQGYADVLIANVQYLLSEGSGEVYFVTVTMRCRDADGRVVGGSFHLACHAPVDRIKVHAAFTSARLEGGQKPSALPWQLVASSRDYKCWAEQGIRSSLVSACSDIEARAAEVFKVKGRLTLPLTTWPCCAIPTCLSRTCETFRKQDVSMLLRC
jgi:hypothetical protein